MQEFQMYLKDVLKKKYMGDGDPIAEAREKAKAEVMARAEAKAEIKAKERAEKEQRKAEKAAKREEEAAAAGHALAVAKGLIPSNTPPPPTTKTFTQDDVNKIVSERLTDERKEKARLLEQVAANAKTAEEKAKAESELDEVRKSMMSKDQAAVEERERIKKEADAEIKKHREEATRVRAAYEAEKISREIQDAALRAKTNEQGTFQLPDLLSKNAKLVELKDDKGQYTGKSEVRVSINTTEGVVEGTPEQVVAKMKADVKRYGNLFAADMVGGLGASAPKTSGEAKKLEDMDQDEFNRAYRKDPTLVGLKKRNRY